MALLGTLVQPLTMTRPSGDAPVAVLGGGPAAELLLGELAALAAAVALAPAEPEVAVAVDSVDALAMMELASLGAIVDVVLLAAAEAELLPEPPEPVRTI